eukprot:TRINITY_DN55769_c0_g1_i1.p1 TRINITY_DN55769_c0_g1~~TRINITY_DN55769_c0_g1_i1.p1  ORF type:complete len:230 (+),score=51.69 TRINITY_DN55769_c0_g1_i1:3-692(+)
MKLGPWEPSVVESPKQQMRQRRTADPSPAPNKSAPGAERISNLFSTLDKDGDGVLDRKEFEAMMHISGLPSVVRLSHNAPPEHVLEYLKNKFTNVGLGSAMLLTICCEMLTGPPEQLTANPDSWRSLVFALSAQLGFWSCLASLILCIVIASLCLAIPPTPEDVQWFSHEFHHLMELPVVLMVLGGMLAATDLVVISEVLFGRKFGLSMTLISVVCTCLLYTSPSPRDS